MKRKQITVSSIGIKKKLKRFCIKGFIRILNILHLACIISPINLNSQAFFKKKTLNILEIFLIDIAENTVWETLL